MNINIPLNPAAAMREAWRLGDYNITATEDEVEEEDEVEDGAPNDWAIHALGPIHDWTFAFADTILPFQHSFKIEATGFGNIDPEDPVTAGCSFSMRDFCRFALFLRVSNAAIGDRLFSSVVGAMGIFLPKPNAVSTALKTNPSMYTTLKLVQNAADLPDDLSFFKIDTCAKGCVPFWKEVVSDGLCPKCDGPRWKHCDVGCFNAAREKKCNHESIAVRNFYVLSIRARIMKLLQSDLRNLFDYEDLRHRSSNTNFVDDIYESSTYKHFKSLMPEGERLIFLQVRLKIIIATSCWRDSNIIHVPHV